MTKPAKYHPPSLKEVAPSPDEWRRLFEAAIRVKEMAPWEWMDESYVFGVQNPETGELGFISVLGGAGEHLGVGLYLGAEGLYGLLEMENLPLTSPEPLMETPQLHASFEDREELEPKDRNLIKKLGFKFSGAQSWPMFRSFRRGYMPWFLNGEETRFLTSALTQVLQVAPRVKVNPNVLFGEKPDDAAFLVRVPHKKGDHIAWKDERMQVDLPEPARVMIALDADMVDEIKKRPQIGIELDLGLRLMPAPIGRKGERPYLPYLLALVHSQSGIVVELDVLKPAKTKVELWEKVPPMLVEWVFTAGCRPDVVHVSPALLSQMIEPVAKVLGFKVKPSDFLPRVDNAMKAMIQWLDTEEWRLEVRGK